jgi:hypothetical protein
MSLLEILNEGPQPREKKCKAAVVLATLSDDVLKRVTEILEKIVNGTGEYSATWLAGTLRQTGVIINHASLLRHGRKECCCVTR